MKINTIIKAMAVFVFSLCLSILVSHLNASSFELEQWPTVLLWTLIWIIVFSLLTHFLKSFLVLLLVGLLMGYVFRDELIVQLVNSEFIESIRWGITLFDYRWAMPTMYPLVFVICMSFISAFVLWLNPIKLFGALILVLPLFFIDDLSVFNWYTPLILGLSAVLINYQDKGPLRLNIALILTIMVAVMILSSVFSPSDFYSRKINNLITKQESIDVIRTFNLRQVGYDSGDAKIGGPITLNDDVFMFVDSDFNDAFYLKGSAYYEFTDDTWRAYTGERYLFEPYLEASDHQRSILNHINIDPSVQLQNLYHTVTITPYVKPITTLFYPGQVHNLQINEDNNVYYDEFGMLVSIPNNDDPYTISGLMSFASRLSFESLFEYPTKLLERSAPSYQFRDSGSLQHDSELYDLVYVDFDTLPSIGNLERIINHFKENYTYETNVAPVPTSNNSTQGFSPVMHFFFDTKEGYCVYYGTALTLLLQDLGFKTRYVEGFVVKDSNEQVTLTNRSAHAWTEIFIEGLGWMILDATPSSYIDSLENPPYVFNPDEMPDFLEPLEPNQPEPVNPEPDVPELPPTDPKPQETSSPYVPWMVSFLIVAGIVLIQQFRFKKKHDPDILEKRLEKDEKKTMIEIYRDMIRLYKLVENHPLNTNSVSATMVQITSQTYIFNKNQVKLASLAINDALYSNKDSHPLAISSLLNLYLSLEKSVQTMSPVWKHYIFRVLFNFR